MGRYANPILPGCHPDPSICRVDDTYYLVTSTFEYLPGLPVHASTNLVDWQLISHAIDRPDQLDFAGLPASKGLFAPTIRHHAGTFYIVCTVVAPSAVDGAAWPGRSGHFIVTATDPRGPWSDPIWLEGHDEIDPSLTFDGDRVWLCGTRLADPGLWRQQTEVWLRELDPATFAVIGDESILWHGAVEGAVWAEGPHLYRHPDGGWMLLASEGGTYGDHAISIAYADEITGPYRGDSGNPRLTHRDLGSRAAIWSVGHADLVDAPDGRTWATLLATHTDDGVDGLLGRQTHLVPVEWEDGRPLFAPGAGRVEAVVVADGVPDQAPLARAWVDDFDEPALGLDWSTPRHHPTLIADTRARPGHVRLHGGGEPSDLGVLAFLGRRLPCSRAEVRAGVELQASGALRAGILLRISESDHLEIAAGADGMARMRLTAGGQTHPVGEVACDPSAQVDLRLRIDGFRADAWVGETLVGSADLRPLSPGGAGSFLGCWVGPFAVGDGYVDVDRVDIGALE